MSTSAINRQASAGALTQAAAQTSPDYASSIRKRAFDVAASVVGLTATAAVFPIVYLAVKASSPGPVLYKQARVGKGGRVFNVVKFRTMRADAEFDGMPRWASQRDPRVTMVGRVLRRTHIDEFPQWWNIFAGDMSVVGPRPERPEFTASLSSEIPGFAERTRVKPGLTGLAQVKAGYARSARDARTKLAYDRAYIQRCSLTSDVRIIAETVKSLVIPSKG